MGAKWGSSARTNKASDLSTQEMRRVQQSFYDEKFHIFMCNAADERYACDAHMHRAALENPHAFYGWDLTNEMPKRKKNVSFFSFQRFAVLGARFTVAISKPINKKQPTKPYDEVVWFRESLLWFGMGNKCRQICLWEIHTGSRVGANISLASISPAGEAKKQ